MLRDIDTREDIETLVDSFYQKALKDDSISHFFTEVVVLDWSVHIPLICDFWETVLLGKVVYKGNPMVKHLELHQLSPLNEQHFDRWLYLWKQSIVNRYKGPVADEAYNRAYQIAQLMKYKIANT